MAASSPFFIRQAWLSNLTYLNYWLNSLQSFKMLLLRILGKKYLDLIPLPNVDERKTGHGEDNIPLPPQGGGR